MSMKPASSNTATAASSSNSGSSRCPAPPDETMITPIIPAPPPAAPTAYPIPKNDTAPMEAAISKIDDFVLTLLYPEQRSILREHAMSFLRAFAEFYTDSKKLLRMTGNVDWIPNNCQVAVPLQPVEGILEIKAYKDLATTVANFSKAISIQIKNFVTKCKTLNNDPTNSPQLNPSLKHSQTSQNSSSLKPKTPLP